MTGLAVAFSVVMNAVAGPEGRYALLSRRWAIFGLTGVIVTFFITRVIDLLPFPLNHALMFMGLSVGGFDLFLFFTQDPTPASNPARACSFFIGFRFRSKLFLPHPQRTSLSIFYYKEVCLYFCHFIKPADFAIVLSYVTCHRFTDRHHQYGDDSGHACGIIFLDLT